MLNETPWHLSHLPDNDYQSNKTQPTSISVPTTTIIPNPNPDEKDKCEPLYTLVYAHCCVWFLFLVLDHVARHMHHKTLRCRGHLKAYARLTRLAAIPFQLVSLWTVLLAIFIAIYAQQDKADMEPYCDANFLMSPKNGIAVLLIIEFILVTISSFLYASSIRKFNTEKPPPDVCGWEEKDDIQNRWTPRALRSESTIGSQSSSRISNSQDLLEQKDSRCILDLLEYYAHANRELAANLGRTSQKLRQLELEVQQSQSSISETIEELP
ncbi:transmembrane protein 192 isoform X2 [Daktulosphaira vitifoliae]|nr:transmembrane protein 192 isoform X2 [Daktulosphaira vitifoliae]